MDCELIFPGVRVVTFFFSLKSKRNDDMIFLQHNKRMISVKRFIALLLFMMLWGVGLMGVFSKKRMSKVA